MCEGFSVKLLLPPLFTPPSREDRHTHPRDHGGCRTLGRARACLFTCLLACFAWLVQSPLTIAICGVAAARNCCGPGCRSQPGESGTNVEAYYDDKYFQWQRKSGILKAKTTNWRKLLNVSRSDTVLDFGAGTGEILSVLQPHVAQTVAVEFSDVARAYESKYHPKIKSYKYPELVPDASVDLVFSTSVIEHVECPITELRELHRKLKPGGRVVIGIKNEGVELWKAWSSSNRDNHLYTWNSVLLGNTLRAAGFVIDHITYHALEHRIEQRINVTKFGRLGHVFQYLYAYGHAPRAGEKWPQNGTRPLRGPQRDA